MESCRSTSFTREVFKPINLRCYLNIKNIVEIVQFKQFVVNGSIFSLGSKEYGTNTLILLFPYSLKSGLAC